jgi:glycosyltransferase involved in cell wall biosynthesis
MQISIVIPTLNEEKYLPKLLQSIKSQKFKDYEIIVADANSKDKTAEIAKKYGAKVVKGGMPAVGRNNGARIAKGYFIFFFDADVKLPKDFLRKAYEELIKRHLELATCECVPLSNLMIDKVAHKLANIYIKLNQYSSPHAAGFCILVKRGLFEKVNGFNEHLKIAEDHDFVKRASRFARLRVLKSVKIRVSIRRLKKEGRFVLIGKYLKVESQMMMRKNLKKDIIAYEFGEFDKKRNTKLDKRLRKLENQINNLDIQYKKFANKNFRKGKLKKANKNNISKNISRLKTNFEKTKDAFRRFLEKRKQLAREKKQSKLHSLHHK